MAHPTLNSTTIPALYRQGRLLLLTPPGGGLLLPVNASPGRVPEYSGLFWIPEQSTVATAGSPDFFPVPAAGTHLVPVLYGVSGDRPAGTVPVPVQFLVQSKPFDHRPELYGVRTEGIPFRPGICLHELLHGPDCFRSWPFPRRYRDVHQRGCGSGGF